MHTTYKSLRVWKKSMQLVKQIYQLASQLPKTEADNLTPRMRRAAVAIPTSIAEGRSRLAARECRFHLGIARGALFELGTQLDLAVHLDYATESAVEPLRERLREVGFLLDRLIRSSNGRQDN
jgi:four helix bundle protein